MKSSLREWRQPLECTIMKGPLQAGSSESEAIRKYTEYAVDVVFPEPVTVGDISFNNYYTASVTIMCKRLSNDASASDVDSLPWESCTSALQLMRHPDYEEGSQKHVSFTQNQSCIPLTNIVSLRLLLRQPSPRWKRFALEDLKIYKECLPENGIRIMIPDDFVQGHQAPDGLMSGDDNMDPKLVCAARHLQNMWALSQFAKTFETTERIGRFEVDGSYEIIQLQHS